MYCTLPLPELSNPIPTHPYIHTPILPYILLCSLCMRSPSASAPQSHSHTSILSYSHTLILLCSLYTCTHPLPELQSELLLQRGHSGSVLAGGREEAQLQLVGLSHHLAEQLVVGEDGSTGERTVVLDALTTHRELEGGGRREGGGREEGGGRREEEGGRREEGIGRR